MAGVFIFRNIFSFSLSVLYALFLISNPSSSRSFTRTLPNSPNFDSETALFGDAGVIIIDNGQPCVKLTRPSTSSTGLLMRTEPFKFLDAKKPTSFSTEFSFSISPGNSSDEGNGDGIVLIFVAGESWSKWSTVEGGSFALSKENRLTGNVGDQHADDVEISLNDFDSSLNLVLSNGDKFKSWIDYDASSKRLEVRLSKSGDRRPYSPIIWRAVDLAGMLGDEDVRVGIASRNGNSSQSASIYSWRFRVRKYPYSMHSFPVDPQGYVVKDEEERGERVRKVKRSGCVLTMMRGLILATVFGALVTFGALFLWGMLVSRREAGCPVYAADFGYKKVDVVVEENSDGLKKKGDETNA
ncbi:hypothetical protein I3760_02G188900 [Carya illinoinensis]|nr:hypothetical protein I3760_02G188900 [Carya illinoinensis]